MSIASEKIEKFTLDQCIEEIQRLNKRIQGTYKQPNADEYVDMFLGQQLLCTERAQTLISEMKTANQITQ